MTKMAQMKEELKCSTIAHGVPSVMIPGVTMKHW